MSRRPYQPPEQSRAGQVIDVVVILALVFGALWAPAFLGMTGAGTVTRELADPTWESLGQTPQMQQAWEKLGMTPETAAPAILTRFDYSIDPLAFGLTAFLLVAYFVFVIRISGREYRQVIAERFGEDEGEARR